MDKCKDCIYAYLENKIDEQGFELYCKLHGYPCEMIKICAENTEVIKCQHGTL